MFEREHVVSLPHIAGGQATGSFRIVQLAGWVTILVAARS
jgi:hypothetical protein